MDETEILFQIPWAQGGFELPREILLFRAGVNATQKGDFIFDEVSADAVMSSFEADGMDKLPFDVGHLMVKGSSHPEGHRAFGWFVPVVKDAVEEGGGLGLYASEIEWTETGSDMLRNREFRFFSPAIRYDSERRITKLINVALTNLPATKNQRPLVLSSDDDPEALNQETQQGHQMTVLLDSLGVADEASAAAKVGEYKALLSALDCEISEAPSKIAQLKSVAADGIKAQAELSALVKERAVEKRSAQIETLCAEGKLLESQRSFAASLSDEQFSAFSATLQAHPALSGAKVQEPVEASEVLSAEERHVLALLPSLQGAL